MPTDDELLETVHSRAREDPRRQAACAELVFRYGNIVRGCVRQYAASPEPNEELAQVGYVGLMTAINNYDPEVGHGLAAYAQPCVSGEIKRHFRDRRWQVRVQRPAQELRLRIRDEGAELAQELARQPSDAELATYLGVSEEEVTEAQLAGQAMQVASLDAPVATADPSEATLADLLGAEDPALERAVDMEAVWKHCAELPERQQHVLNLRFFGNMTQAEIGEELGISQMHVSRLLTRSLTYLREQITGTSRQSPGRARRERASRPRHA